MKPRTWIVVVVIAAVLTFSSENLNAGRRGGPASAAGYAYAYRSVFYDVPFVAGRSAVVALSGNGATNMELILYDSDNHIVVGTGVADQKVVTMDVYRTGMFRIEVRNLGPRDNSFVIQTN